MNTLIGYRKTLLTILVFGASVGLLLGGVLTPELFVQLNQIIVPAFLASNVVEHMMDKKS